MNKNKTSIFYFMISSLLIATGFFSWIHDITKSGKHYLTQQNTVFGGPIIIFLGLIALIIGYYSLSPFGRVRKFFENGLRRKK